MNNVIWHKVFWAIFFLFGKKYQYFISGDSFLIFACQRITLKNVELGALSWIICVAVNFTVIIILKCFIPGNMFSTLGGLEFEWELKTVEGVGSVNAKSVLR